jgi:hypothetical protein
MIVRFIGHAGIAIEEGGCMLLIDPKRAQVSALIGAPAERLAYLFSVADRPVGLIRALETRSVYDSVQHIRVAVSAEEVCALLAIECANLLEQQDMGTFCKTALETAQAAHFPLDNTTRSILTAHA